jgi:hypothetical protein
MFQPVEKLVRYNDDISHVRVGPVGLILEQRSPFGEDILAVGDELANNTISRELERLLRIQQGVLSMAVEERVLHNEKSEKSNAAKDCILEVVQKDFEVG